MSLPRPSSVRRAVVSVSTLLAFAALTACSTEAANGPMTSAATPSSVAKSSASSAHPASAVASKSASPVSADARHVRRLSDDDQTALQEALDGNVGTPTENGASAGTVSDVSMTGILGAHQSDAMEDASGALAHGKVTVACMGVTGHLDVTVTPDKGKPNATVKATMGCPGTGFTYAKTVFTGALAAHHSVTVTNPMSADAKYGVRISAS